METSKLAIAAVAMAVVPALVSFGCNKKEDLAPAPTATQTTPPPPPPPASPPPPPAAIPAPITPAAPVKTAVRSAAAHDGSVVAVPFPDAAVVALPGLPQIPSLDPSALPAIANGIVGGIVAATSGLIPPLPVPSR